MGRPIRIGAVLEEQVKYFRTVQDTLAATRHGRIALIHAKRIAGTYGSYADAWAAAREKGLAPGTFAIQRCVRRDEEEPVRFRSRVG